MVDLTQACDRRVVIDPDDPDGEERDRVRGIARPHVGKLMAEVAAPRVRDVEIKHEQRDGDSEHAVGERLESTLAHLPTSRTPITTG